LAITSTLYERFDDVPAGEWNAIADDDGSLSMDLRLLSAFERTMRNQCTCWAALMRDNSARLVAAAALCVFKVDALDSTSPLGCRIVGAIRKIFPNFLRFNVLFCGLPVPCGETHLRMVDNSYAAEVVDELHRVMRDLARTHKARLFVVKELDERPAALSEALVERGFLRGEIPPLHLVDGERFASFDEYRGALKARYRAHVNRSRRKVDEAGFTVERVRGAKVAELFTDDLHRLYLAVWKRSKVRLEQMSAEFFRECARALPDETTLTLVRRSSDDRIVAFVFALVGRGVYYSLYCGIDYQFNNSGDLYFNLFYRALEQAFASGAAEIHLGQTSDVFKSRLGTTARPLHFFVRAANPILHRGLKLVSRLAFPPVARVRKHDVFASPRPKARWRADAILTSAGSVASPTTAT